MNDKELADKVVALGIVELAPNRLYYIGGGIFSPICRKGNEERLLSDWRVAGALMEKCQNTSYERLEDENNELDFYEVDAVSINENYGRGSNKSLPRAIIEATVEALSNGGR